MGKDVGKIGLVLVVLGVLCLIFISAVTVLSQKNHGDIQDSPLFTLRAQRAIDNDVDFSVEYLTKEHNNIPCLFNFTNLQEGLGNSQNSGFIWSSCISTCGCYRSWLPTCDYTCSCTGAPTCWGTPTCTGTCSSTCSGNTCGHTICAYTCWATCNNCD